jgi:hypothetical protein
MSAKEYEKMSDSEKKKEDWMNSKWRPMMGWTYMITCLFDFIVAPILWSLLQSLSHGQVNVQWQPLTLQGAGLFHIAMGAVLGIAAYGRTQEKMNGANNGGIALPANVGTTYTPPAAPAAQPNFGTPTHTTVTQSFGQPAPMSSGGFGAPAGGFAPSSSFAAQPGFDARPAQPTGRVSPKTGREMILAPHQDQFGADGEPEFKGDPEGRE